MERLLQYASLTLLESERCEGEVRPYQKTDYKPISENVIIVYIVNIFKMYLVFHLVYYYFCAFF